jgi:hypothetical protein
MKKTPSLKVVYMLYPNFDLKKITNQTPTEILYSPNQLILH